MDKVEKMLDRGQWKHTWHLKRNSYGGIAWSDPEVEQKVKEQIRETREDAMNLLKLAQEAEDQFSV